MSGGITTKPEITVIPCGGLCNRLRAIASAAVLAEHRGCEWQIHWTSNPFCCNETLEALFPGLSERRPEPPPNVPQLPRVTPSLTMDCPPPGISFAIQSLSTFRARSMEWPDWRRRYVDFLSRLVPSQAIQNRLLDLPPGTTGLQIRRNDHRIATFQSPLNLFTDAVERQLDGDGSTTSFFFLTTDCDQVRTHLSRRFGRRILTRRDQLVGRTSPGGIIEAAADLWTLARTEHILSSAHSTFGKTAAAIGARKYTVLRLPWFPTACEKDPINRELDLWLRWEQTRGLPGSWHLRPLSEQRRLLLRPLRRYFSLALNRLGYSPFYQHFPWSRMPGIHTHFPGFTA